MADKNFIYLDNAATTIPSKEVVALYNEIEINHFGNSGSIHKLGVDSLNYLNKARESIVKSFGIKGYKVYFTSSSTEANNLAIKGIARAQRNYGKHIISTTLEHPSVSGPLTWLQEQGYEIDLVDIARDGKIDTGHLKELLRDDTILVAITAVDSELGVIQPVKEIAQIIKAKQNCRLHVDATQAIGKIPFSFEGFDTVSLAAHKFYGLNGSGVLFKKNDIVIDPLIHGGSGATLYRSGTPTLALAVAFETALRLSLETLPQRCDKVHYLNKCLRSAFKAYSEVRINSPDDAVPHILNVSVPGVKGVKMQQLLADREVCVSVESACSTEGTPSKAVFAVSKDRKNALSSWRISLSHLTTEDEIERFLEIFDQCLKEIAV